ncbi:MAG: hypothetical protein K0R92_3238, partial [Lachnospiraceae bacterium]|nr:hypothetical protein [Lachnospiraceae bacterium]
YLKYSFAILSSLIPIVPDAFGKLLMQGACVYYLVLLSYGIPSAFGALDFLEVKTKTTIVAT